MRMSRPRPSTSAASLSRVDFTCGDIAAWAGGRVKKNEVPSRGDGFASCTLPRRDAQDCSYRAWRVAAVHLLDALRGADDLECVARCGLLARGGGGGVRDRGAWGGGVRVQNSGAQKSARDLRGDRRG